MSTLIGNDNAKSIYIGQEAAEKVYVGNKLVWKKKQPSPYPEGALYWEGEEFVNKTGGWDILVGIGSVNAITKNTNSISMYDNYPYGYNTSLTTHNKIDLTNYTKLKVHLLRNATNFSYILTSVNTVNTQASNIILRKDQQGVPIDGIVELDITSITSNVYIAVGNWGGNKENWELDKIWLE